MLTTRTRYSWLKSAQEKKETVVRWIELKKETGVISIHSKLKWSKSIYKVLRLWNLSSTHCTDYPKPKSISRYVYVVMWFALRWSKITVLAHWMLNNRINSLYFRNESNKVCDFYILIRLNHELDVLKVQTLFDLFQQLSKCINSARNT